MDHDGTRIFNAIGDHTATVILLHGLGGDSVEWKGITQWGPIRREAMAHVKWIFPQAGKRSITKYRGRPMSAWYNVFPPAEMQCDESGMTESKDAISQIIADEIACGIASDRIVLGGFSQGCAMTYLAGLTFEQRLGGLICLSGRLPIPEKWESGNWKVSEHAKMMPIFWGHGGSDREETFTLGLEAKEMLVSQFGFREVTDASPLGIYSWSDDKMGHTISREEQESMGRWLNSNLPEKEVG